MVFHISRFNLVNFSTCIEYFSNLPTFTELTNTHLYNIYLINLDAVYIFKFFCFSFLLCNRHTRVVQSLTKDFSCYTNTNILIYKKKI